MKATADAVQVQAQNSITLAQIWEPQMQHHELQKCRTEHAAGQRPLLPQSQRAGEQRRHDEDRRTDDGESVKVATTGSSCSTELHTPDWMTGGRAGGHSSIRDGGSSQRAEKRTGRHELIAATGSSTADERAAGEAVKVQQIDDERVVDELLLLCRDDGSWTGGRRLRNGRIRDGRGRRDGRTGGSAAGGDEDDGTDGHGADREDGGGSRRAGAAAPLPRPDRRWDREDDELSRDGGGGRRRIPSWRGEKMGTSAAAAASTRSTREWVWG